MYTRTTKSVTVGGLEVVNCPAHGETHDYVAHNTRVGIAIQHVVGVAQCAHTARPPLVHDYVARTLSERQPY